jgi:hypothetical protein
VESGPSRQNQDSFGGERTSRHAGPRLSNRFLSCLLVEAFAIATAFERAVYDTLYVALAVNSKSQIVTADERLATALAAHLPVKWLGSL